MSVPAIIAIIIRVITIVITIISFFSQHMMMSVFLLLRLGLRLVAWDP